MPSTVPLTVGQLLRLLHSFRGEQSLFVLVAGEAMPVVGIREQEDGRLTLLVPTSDAPAVGQKPAREPADDDVVAEALEQCDRILSDCNEIPEKGEDFAASVSEKVESIRAWIDEHKHVTPAQLASLEKMEEGVGRWLHH